MEIDFAGRYYYVPCEHNRNSTSPVRRAREVLTPLGQSLLVLAAPPAAFSMAVALITALVH
jgi:hypothetical protein